MTDDASPGPQGAHQQEATGPALRLVRGDASPEELAALVAILATIPSSGTSDDGQDRAARPSSQWIPRRRIFPSTYPRRPGGWRASGLPR